MTEVTIFIVNYLELESALTDSIVQIPPSFYTRLKKGVASSLVYGNNINISFFILTFFPQIQVDRWDIIAVNHICTIFKNSRLNFLHVVWIIADKFCKRASLSDGVQLLQGESSVGVVALVPEAIPKTVPLESPGYDAGEGLSQDRPSLRILANAPNI